MSDTPLTAAAIMHFAEELEDRSAALYADLAARFPAQAALFQGFAVDCGKHKTQIVRTYQETVTDALETNYSFEGLKLNDYQVSANVPAGASLSEAVAAAQALEQGAIAFYEAIAASSGALLATIPGAFRRVARRRAARLSELGKLA
jgi:rubrerythrin